jgi:2-methylcitrate dehydratase
MSSIVRQTFSRSCRNLRRRAPLCASSARGAQQFSKAPFLQQRLPIAQPTRAFSATMIPKSDAAAAPAAPQEFDKEIVDMADYASNYKVDSDLAVSCREKLL